MEDGRTTRGKTRPGRLARLDRWLLAQDFLDGVDAPLVVDVGLGAHPDTTVELFQRLRTRWPTAEVLGIDIDVARVVAAAPHARPGLTFAHQGFPLELDRPATVIRAMNVLRQYPPDQANRAHQAWVASLAEGGVLLEGTCGPVGDVIGCHVIRRHEGGGHREALLLAADDGQGFAPMMLRPRLPRDLRDQTGPDHPIRQLLDRWTEAWEAVRTPEMSPADAFERSVEELARRGEPIQLEAGLAAWRPPDGVPGRHEA